jgi:hypothetical protein
LRQRALAIAQERDIALAKRLEAERRRQAKEAEKARRARLDAIKKRGNASVWREIEDEIGRSNAPGYEQAISLLSDLQALALEQNDRRDFDQRVASIRVRHERKKKFIERLVQLESDQAGGRSDRAGSARA